MIFNVVHLQVPTVELMTFYESQQILNATAAQTAKSPTKNKTATLKTTNNLSGTTLLPFSPGGNSSFGNASTPKSSSKRKSDQDPESGSYVDTKL